MIARRIIVALLTVALAVAGLPASSASPQSQASSTDSGDTSEAQGSESSEEETSYSGLNDPALLQRIEDQTYAELEEQLGSDDYQVEDVVATYVSKEYLDELAYNSQENIYFGYTSSELQERFGDQKYLFTLDDEGHTTVKAVDSDDSVNQVVRNVAIGTGVIIVCATVTVATAATDGAAAPIAARTVHALFAYSARNAALLGGGLAIVGVADGVAEGVKTGDMETGLKHAAVSASEGFKWGAIIGASTTAASNALPLVLKGGVVRTWHESEEAVHELYGGRTQVSYLDGKEVSSHLAGATKPDDVADIDGKMTAIEVKNYDLVKDLSGLKSELRRQLTQRKIDLPEGFAQRVVVDVKGRGYSKEFLAQTLNDLQTMASEIDPTIVVEYLTK